MDTKSKILVAMFALIFLVSAVLTYYRTMVVRDFAIFGASAQTE